MNIPPVITVEAYSQAWHETKTYRYFFTKVRETLCGVTLKIYSAIGG